MDLIQVIEQIGREKGIDAETIIAAVEDAIVTASRKNNRSGEEFVAHLDRASGKIELFARKAIVEAVTDPDTQIDPEEAKKYTENPEIGGFVEIQRPTEGLGRIAAQAAKQVIVQKVRDAEREKIHEEFSRRTGEVVNGLVKRFEKGDIIVDLGKTEAIMPRRNLPRGEIYNPGDRIRAAIVEVRKSAKEPQVILSRTDPLILVRLFEMEVPEIYDGTVVLKNAVREPGERAKVSVASKERDVDPVGACVGMKGSRVQSIIRELRGEKIDIVQWSEDICVFAANALSPAKISRVSVLDEDRKILEVVVEERQLSLAIGKKGQNVRLASKLVEWTINIKSEEEKKREVEQEMARMSRRNTPLADVPGLGDKTVDRLIEAGFDSCWAVAGAASEDLLKIPGIGPKSLEKIQMSVAQFLEPPVPPPAAEDEAAGEPVSGGDDQQAKGSPADGEVDSSAHPPVEAGDASADPETGVAGAPSGDEPPADDQADPGEGPETPA